MCTKEASQHIREALKTGKVQFLGVDKVAMCKYLALTRRSTQTAIDK